MFVKPNHLYEHPALIFPPLFDLFVCVSALNSHLIHCFDSLLFMIQLSLHLQAAHWDTEQRVTMATSLSLLWEYDISIYIYKVYIISVLRFCLMVFLLFELFVIWLNFSFILCISKITAHCVCERETLLRFVSQNGGLLDSAGRYSRGQYWKGTGMQ